MYYKPSFQDSVFIREVGTENVRARSKGGSKKKKKTNKQTKKKKKNKKNQTNKKKKKKKEIEIGKDSVFCLSILSRLYPEPMALSPPLHKSVLSSGESRSLRGTVRQIILGDKKPGQVFL